MKVSTDVIELDRLKFKIDHLDPYIERRMYMRRRLNEDEYNVPLFKREKLADWRRLETLAFSTRKKSNALRRLYWQTLADYGKKGKACGAKSVVITSCKDSKYATVYDIESKSISSSDIDKLITEKIGKPDERYLVLTGEILARIHRLEKMTDTWQYRFGVVTRCFHEAVEARLQTTINQMVDREHAQLFGANEMLRFELSNDERNYTISVCGYGTITWPTLDVPVIKVI